MILKRKTFGMFGKAFREVADPKKAGRLMEGISVATKKVGSTISKEAAKKAAISKQWKSIGIDVPMRYIK